MNDQYMRGNIQMNELMLLRIYFCTNRSLLYPSILLPAAPFVNDTVAHLCGDRRVAGRGSFRASKVATFEFSGQYTGRAIRYGVSNGE